MTMLSLNKAAKEAKVAKSTLLEALKTGKISASRNDRGHWQIDPAELFRVFGNHGSERSPSPRRTDDGNRSETTSQASEVEVQMLREKIELLEAERVRERDQLKDQIDHLKEQVERQSADHRQAIAALTDQRKRGGILTRIFGS